VVSVRNALHVRTGQPAAAGALDAWLDRHGVERTAFDDVYSACVHLLTQYERVPDLVFVGADWLLEDEFGILRYLRETWPRVGIVVYGRTDISPALHVAPLVCACPTQAALDRLLAETPARLLERLCAESSQLWTAPKRLESERRPDAIETHAPPAQRVTCAAPALSEPDPPRALLTAEELAALLDDPDES